MRSFYCILIYLISGMNFLHAELPQTISADEIYNLTMADEFTRVKTLDGLGFKFDENDKERASFARGLLDEGTACARYNERFWLWKDNLFFIEYVSFDSTSYYQIKEEIINNSEPFTLKGIDYVDWKGLHVQFDEATVTHQLCVAKVYFLYLTNYNPHSHSPLDDHDHNHDDHSHD